MSDHRLLFRVFQHLGQRRYGVRVGHLTQAVRALVLQQRRLVPETFTDLIDGGASPEVLEGEQRPVAFLHRPRGVLKHLPDRLDDLVLLLITVHITHSIPTTELYYSDHSLEFYEMYLYMTFFSPRELKKKIISNL